MLNFQVIRDYNGKPIRNASVVMHPVEKNGKQGKGGLQIKTDADGKASYEGAPYGKLRIQVLAGEVFRLLARTTISTSRRSTSQSR